MRARSLAFLAGQTDEDLSPLVVVTLWTPMGARVFSRRGLTDAELWTDALYVLDGSRMLDGSWVLGAGSLPVISREARVLDISPIRDEASILALAGLGRSQSRAIGSVEVTLANDDDWCGQVLAADVFLSGRLNVILGYRGQRRDQFMTRHQGIVQDVDLTRETCLLRSESA